MHRNELKYKQIVKHITDGVASGKYKNGDKIPSVNDFRKMYPSSRDTVFAGLNELKSRGIIDSLPGVGYFVTSTHIPLQKKIFLLFNEFNEFKEDLYKSFIRNISTNDYVNICFHNYNRKVFETLLTDANGKYTTYIIMSGKFQGIEPLLRTITGRVFLLDHFHPELKGKFSSVAQNFEKDTYEALTFGLPYIRKYRRILMVQREEKEPYERYYGLQRFADEHGFEHHYQTNIKNCPIQRGDLYILVNDRDLVDLLKQSFAQAYTAGNEFGIISYNDTPLKEILSGGITTLSTDFKQMGCIMSKLINRKTIETIENPCNLNIRKSL
jgi:DNA-binding transcriptional regulator YhcF (GntR family)